MVLLTLAVNPFYLGYSIWYLFIIYYFIYVIYSILRIFFLVNFSFY